MMKREEMDTVAHQTDADDMIKDAERSKLLVNRPRGKELKHHYEIDDAFYALGAHLTETMKLKIMKGE